MTTTVDDLSPREQARYRDLTRFSTQDEAAGKLESLRAELLEGNFIGESRKCANLALLHLQGAFVQGPRAAETKLRDQLLESARHSYRQGADHEARATLKQIGLGMSALRNTQRNDGVEDRINAANEDYREQKRVAIREMVKDRGLTQSQALEQWKGPMGAWERDRQRAVNNKHGLHPERPFD